MKIKELKSLIKKSDRTLIKGIETANESQASTEQILRTFRTVEEMIAALSELLARQAKTVKEISQALRRVNEVGQSISAATNVQTTNINQVSMAIGSLNKETKSVASATELMSSAAKQLAGLAQKLQTLTSQFKLIVDVRAQSKAEEVSTWPISGPERI